MTTIAPSLAAVGVTGGQFSGNSFVYGLDGKGNILEYNTSPMKLGSLPATPFPYVTVASGVLIGSQIAALSAAGGNNRWLIHVYYINDNGVLADIGKIMGQDKWIPGALAHKGYEVSKAQGLQYAIANDSLLRVGFWAIDGELCEVVSPNVPGGAPNQWSEVIVLNQHTQQSIRQGI